MLLEILAAVVFQAEAAPPVPSNPAPTTSASRWPGDEKSPFRWTLNAPADKRPFLIAWSSNWNYQIAVRSAFDQSWPVSDRTYYVAMRENDGRLEEADSRECAFADSMAELRSLPAPELIVPGTLPLQDLANPVLAHENSSITVVGARQQNGDPADVTISSPGGEVAPWVQRLYERTRECWKPMASSGN